MEGGEHRSRSPCWHDYLEVALLILACVLGLVGNMAVLRVSLRIRSFSRQVSLLFCGILCADLLVCASRIPTTIYLIFSSPPTPHPRVDSTVGGLLVTSPMTLSDVEDSGANARRLAMSGNKDTDSGKVEVRGEGGHHKERHSMGSEGDSIETIVACEVWAANSALMLTIVWLHLAVGAQRLAIIFSFSKYRKIFTHTLTRVMVVGAWCLGLLVVYTPLRAVGMPMELAGRGACRAEETTSENVLIARSAAMALLCLLPLLVTMACYVIVMRSVWLAREVRTESASEYNRVVLVTLGRLLSLLLTYFPVCVLLMAEVKVGAVSDAAQRYVGHLLWLQSVLSPYVTLQDNDFRDKMMVPNKHAHGTHKNGEQQHARSGENGEVMPDIGSSGGQDGEEHRARNLREMNREIRRSQLQRGISFITSAGMRTAKGSTE